MQGTASILETLCSQQPITRSNYRQILAGDGYNLYDTTPGLSQGIWYRFLAQSQHPIVVDKSFENVSLVFKQTIEGVTNAHANFQKATDDLHSLSVKQAQKDYQFWGGELTSLLCELERLEKDMHLLISRWKDFREIAAHLKDSSEQTPPSPYLASLSLRLLSLGGASAGLLAAMRFHRRYRARSPLSFGLLLPVVAFWPVAKEEEPVENVDLPENGLNLLLAALPSAREYDRLESLHRQVGLFPPVKPLIDLAQASQKPKWTPNSLTHELKAWMNTLNETPSVVRLLHQVLLDLSRHLKGDANETCAQIEWALRQGGCTVFDQEDPLHKQWVSKLQSGMQIRGKERVEVLDQPLGSGRWTIKNSPKIVIFHPLNEAILGINQADQKKTHRTTGLTLVKIGPLIGDGRATYSEPIVPAIERHWKNDQTDQAYQKTFLAEFKKIIKDKKSPNGRLDELLYVNGEGEVRWLIPTKEVEDIDLEKLEEYFSRCSSSNLQCFEYWMRETGLLDNPLAATMRKNLVEHLTVDLKNSDLYANYFTHAIDAVRLNFEIPNEEKENNFTLLRNRMLSVLASCLREASAIVRPPRDLPERLVRAVMLKKPYQLNPDSLEKRAKLLPGGKRSHIDFINAGIYHSKDIQTVNGKK